MVVQSTAVVESVRLQQIVGIDNGSPIALSNNMLRVFAEYVQM